MDEQKAKDIYIILSDKFGIPASKQAAIELIMNGITSEQFAEYKKTQVGQSTSELWINSTYNRLKDMEGGHTDK